MTIKLELKPPRVEERSNQNSTKDSLTLKVRETTSWPYSRTTKTSWTSSGCTRLPFQILKRLMKKDVHSKKSLTESTRKWRHIKINSWQLIRISQIWASSSTNKSKNGKLKTRLPSKLMLIELPNKLQITKLKLIILQLCMPHGMLYPTTLIKPKQTHSMLHSMLMPHSSLTT